MSDYVPGSDGSPDPDQSEEELAPEIDNAVPTFAYHKTRVVGLGGSAGSIGAMQKFFEGMRPDCGMAFVVVLHLSPEHESALGDILQRSSKMLVSVASDGQKVEPNEVYVIPPGKQITLADGHLRLSELPREPGRRMTVDLFFRSLADTHGPHAVGIVLSGGDGDGALGIKRIKERGGLTIAQDPELAEHPGMPRAAIATAMVDWVLRAEEIPERLLEYQARESRMQVPPEQGPNPAVAPKPSSNADEAALRDVLTFLRTRTGRDFTYYKRATIVRRVARRMQVNEVDSLPAYLTYLRTHPGEAGALLQDLLISVTNFFRDREAFDALERLIPALFEKKTHSDAVRVWVPACATGEEAYSIAILLIEHARKLESPPVLQIFATDLDEEVLAEARTGIYPDAISTDVSAERLRRFFVKEHQGYRVRREVREMVLFAVHDLLKDSPFSRLDLVSCRNLLIYLSRDAQKRAFDIFHFALRESGRLFLGSSESVEDGNHTFYAVDKKHRIYAPFGNIRSSLPIPTGQSTLARVLTLEERDDGSLGRRPMMSMSALVPASLDQTPSERISWGELHLTLIERLGPPSLIVNSDHEILHLSKGVAPFLQFAGGEPSANLLTVIHPMLRLELRAALFRARQGAAPVTVENVRVDLEGQPRLVTIRVAGWKELAAELLLVTFELVEGDEQAARVVHEKDEPIVRHLERELEQTRRQLRDIVEQHEASTEELKASNEELQAMNEELRSATEELETSREELQSINEELSTVNHELKGKVDELAHANSDLHNLMGATAIATVFLDRDLRIMRFTPPAVDLFSLIPTDVGRPLSDLQHRLAYPNLLDDASRVLQQLVPVEREVGENGGRVFLARLLPYRTTEDRIAGVVLTFVDITERQLAQQAVQEAHSELERRVQERTAQLDLVNVQLREEVGAHRLAEKARRELQRRLVHAQEEERSRISRELHDEVGQEVTALMLSLKSLEATSSSDNQVKLRQLRATADKIAAEIHQLAFQLRPVALDELGVARALAGYLDSWQARTGINVDFVSSGIEQARLPNQLETAMYRIVQEAMNNVYKHAQASNVSVTVERRGNVVVAIVEDDGAGFDSDAVQVHGDRPRIGIAGMRERAAIIGGELAVESSPGTGTTVRVRVPIMASVPPPL